MDLKWLTPMEESEFNSFLRQVMPVNNEINMLRNFMETVKAGIAGALKEHEEVCAVPFEPDEEYRRDIEEWQQETTIEITNFYPRMAWSSTFLSIYSLLEHEMISVVKHMGAVKGITRHPEHKAYVKEGRRGIYAAKEYLLAHFEMDATLDKRWPELESLTLIRNRIAHDRGVLEEPPAPGAASTDKTRDDKIREYAAKHPDLMHIDADHQLTLREEFCAAALKTVESFMDRLIDEARLWLGRWQIANGVEPKKEFKIRYLTPRIPFKY